MPASASIVRLRRVINRRVNDTDDDLPDDIEALKRWCSRTVAARIATREIEQLKLIIAKLQRLQFGRPSEKLEREIEQLELAAGGAADHQAPVATSADRCGRKAERAAALATAARAPAARARRARAGLHLPGLRRRDAQDRRGRLRGPGVRAGALQGDPARAPEARLSGVRAHRAGGGALATDRSAGSPGRGCSRTVLVAKYADHLPLYRQSEIYAREGVELERSTMAEWVGRLPRCSSRWSRRWRAT